MKATYTLQYWKVSKIYYHILNVNFMLNTFNFVNKLDQFIVSEDNLFTNLHNQSKNCKNLLVIYNT